MYDKLNTNNHLERIFIYFFQFSSYDISGVFQDTKRFAEVFLLDKDVVSVEGGNREDPDPVFCENAGDFGQDPDQGKVKNALDPESFPAVFPFDGFLRGIFCPADKGKLFICLPDEIKIICQIKI